jgi:hypothetical protein
MNNVNTDTEQFMNAMDALGLIRHVNFITHKMGNTIDQMFTEETSAISINACFQGPVISDHFVVIAHMTVEKSKTESVRMKSRKLRDIDPTSFSMDLNFSETIQEEDLETSVHNLERELMRVLDIHAPEKLVKVTNR